VEACAEPRGWGTIQQTGDKRARGRVDAGRELQGPLEHAPVQLLMVVMIKRRLCTRAVVRGQNTRHMCVYTCACVYVSVYALVCIYICMHMCAYCAGEHLVDDGAE
jgi:hypothetical protein